MTETSHDPSPSRRRFLRLCATTAASTALAGTAKGKEKPENAPVRPTVGIATFGFGALSNAALAEELASAGLRTIQLFLSQSDSNYWRYNSRSDLSGLSDARCREIAETYRARDISIHSIGVYTNLIHPDAEERKANLDYFERMMEVGDAMGVHTFITEAGHYHPEGKAGNIAYHFRDDVWPRMIGVGKELARRADARGATVLCEPYFGGFLASAKRTRLFLEEVGSKRIRALLDPANLLEVNDLEEMFAQLGPWIDCLHAKDRKLHAVGGVAAGLGDLDYAEFVRLAREKTPHAPFILEYVNQDTYRDALAHLKRHLPDA